jgi:hypothetical protein
MEGKVVNYERQKDVVHVVLDVLEELAAELVGEQVVLTEDIVDDHVVLADEPVAAVVDELSEALE